jgi:tetratricopeptide (TPR) repeat protein
MLTQAMFDLEVHIGYRARQKNTLFCTVSLRLTSTNQQTTLLADQVEIECDLDRLDALLRRGDMQEYGIALTQMMFWPPALYEAWHSVKQHIENGVLLHLRFTFEADEGGSELFALRWETLCDPSSKQPLAMHSNILFSRYRAIEPAYVVPEMVEPTLLVAIANPQGIEEDFALAPIDVDTEIMGLEGDYLYHRQQQGPILARGLTTGCTLPNLQQALQYPITILYLVCHGALIEGEPCLYLEKNDGTTDIVTGDAFCQMIKRLPNKPRLVVLAACQSANPGDGGRNALGVLLNKAGIPAVVAMSGSIEMQAVAVGIPTLFRSLAGAGNIATALAQARTAIAATPQELGMERRDDWGQLVLITSAADGQLWKALHSSPVPRCESPQEKEPGQFLGRADLITAIIKTLQHSAQSSQVCTIYGPPGAGKTDLLRWIGIDIRTTAHFYDGVLYAEFGLRPDIPAVLKGWIRSFGEVPPDTQVLPELYEKLNEVLSKRCVFVIIDDLWEEALEEVRSIVNQLGARCRMLVSAREIALAETLSNVSEPRPVHVEGIGVEEALNLLRRFANKKRDLITPELSVARNLVQGLDRLPLAVRLAGGLLASYPKQKAPCARLLNTWESSLKDLRERGGHKRDTIYISLEAIIARSYDGLPANLRRAARQLGAFGNDRPSWDIHALKAVWGIEEREAERWRRELMERSLIFERNTTGEESRDGMYQTIAAFLAHPSKNKMKEFATLREAEHRHSNYFLTLSQTWAAELIGDNQSEALRIFANERSNLIILIERAIRDADVHTMLAFGAAIWRFWTMSGDLVRGQQWLDTILQQPDVQQVDASHPLCEQKAAVLFAAAELARARNQLLLAEQHLERALALYQKRLAILSPDQRTQRDSISFEMARVYYTRAGILWQKADTVEKLSDIQSYLNKALEGFKADPWRTAMTEALIGMTYYALGQHKEAVDWLEQSVSAFRDKDDYHYILYLNELAWTRFHAHLQASVPDPAAQPRREFAEALRLRREQQQSPEGDEEASDDEASKPSHEDEIEAIIYQNIGWMEAVVGNIQPAREALAKAVYMFHTQEDFDGIAACLDAYTVLAMTQQQWQQAAHLLGLCQQMHEDPKVETKRRLFDQQQHEHRRALVQQELTQLSYDYEALVHHGRNASLESELAKLY